MNTKVLFSLFLAMMYGQALAADGKITINTPTLAYTGVAPPPAAGGKITITPPADNAMVSPMAKVSVNYEAMLGPNGDHLHLYVDGKRVDVLRQLKGSAELGALPPGKHKVCLTENTKSHAATGVEACINVTSK